jgi:hypothetical protein
MPSVSGLRYFAREIASSRDRRIRQLRLRFSGRPRLKIALRGQDQERCGREQQQVVG